MYKKNFLISILLSLCLVAIFQAPAAEADSLGYQPGLQHLYPYYVPEEYQLSLDPQSLNLSPSSNSSPSSYVRDFGFNQLRLNEQGSVIFASALYDVSQLDPAFNQDGRCGLAGWQCAGERWQRLEAFAQNHSLSPLSLEAQLGFVNLELNNLGANDTQYQSLYQGLQNPSSFEGVANSFLQDYLAQPPTDLSQIALDVYGYDVSTTSFAPTSTQGSASGEPMTETPSGASSSVVFRPNTIDCRAGDTSSSFLATTDGRDSHGPYLLRLTVIGFYDPEAPATVYAHRCLRDSLELLLNDYNQTITDPTQKLGGWVWRSHQTQIALRRKNCGTSNYDVWEKPADDCSPPTARPGRSSHQDGLAIDFYCQAETLSRNNCGQAFRWLDCQAARYGLINLPSETWHWYFPLHHPDRLTAKLQQGCS